MAAFFLPSLSRARTTDQSAKGRSPCPGHAVISGSCDSILRVCWISCFGSTVGTLSQAERMVLYGEIQHALRRPSL